MQKSEFSVFREIFNARKGSAIGLDIAAKKGERIMIMIMMKRRMWAGLCLLLIALLVVPGFVIAGDKININTASRDQLCELTGVGPAIADRIIEYREKNGPFKSIEEITQVKGIGEGIFLKIKEGIVVK